MPLDLELAPEEVAIQDAVTRFCQRHIGADRAARRDAVFSRPLWTTFAEIGVLEAVHPAGGNRMLAACAALEALGAAGFPGPAVHAVALSGVVDEAEWEAIASGAKVATVGSGPAIAWADIADLVFVVEDGRVQRVIVESCKPAGTLGHSHAAQVKGPRAGIGDAAPLLARYDTAVAATLQGAGHDIIEAVSDHARTRRQFGKALGEFQAVAFPLAQARMKLDAARILARAAAMAIERERPDSGAMAAAARLSATRAALGAAYAAHQTYGALGQIEDGPVAWMTRRIQEYAVLLRGPQQLRASLPLDVVGALDADAWTV